MVLIKLDYIIFKLREFYKKAENNIFFDEL